MKTKYYDKQIYAKNESIKGALVVIVAFTIGFISGCMAINIEKQKTITELQKTIEEKQKKITEQFIELDSLRETVYMYSIYGK